MSPRAKSSAATKTPSTAKNKKAATAKKATKKPPATSTGKSKSAKSGKPAKSGKLDPSRLQAILDGLDALYPDADCELDHANAFQLLVATILSAQCTDKMVNSVTPALFARYPDPAALAGAEQADVEKLVSKTGFFRQKAKNIIATSRLLAREHDGEVPRDMDALRSLPGVARKTANVVLGTAYGIPSGVVVDTHIARLSQRLGLTRHDDPVKIEQDLMAILPKDRWIKFGHQLIWHGRRVCSARKPSCGDCALAPHCPSAFKV